MARRFFTMDVFTEEALAGNPLAVVLDGEGLDAARMQAIAREFNLSETVFVLAPEAARHRARLRIFTPTQELAFAGHPLVGAASLLAILDGRAAEAFALEIEAGLVTAAATRLSEDTAYARFRAPKAPVTLEGALTPAEAAAVLGLSPGDIGFARHAVSRVVSGGAVFQCVPVASIEALSRAAPQGPFRSTLGADLCYVFTAAATANQADWRARMFAPQIGVPEDPATGSAAVCLAGALMQAEPLGDGTHDIVILQGAEMGRPSRIALQMVIQGGRLDHVEIGGRAVIVAEGALRL